MPSHDGRKCHATIKIENVLKGKIKDAEVILEFLKFEDGEESVIDKNIYAVGSKGTACLAKLPNGYYKEIRGWTYCWNLNLPKRKLSLSVASG